MILSEYGTLAILPNPEKLSDSRENIVSLLNLENTITLLDINKYHPYSLYHTKNFIVVSNDKNNYIYSLDGVLVDTILDEYGY